MYYYDWYIDRYLFRASNLSNTSFLNPFNSNSNNSNNSAAFIQRETQRKYQEGISLLKSKIREEAEKQGDYDKVLSKYTSDTTIWNKDIIKPNLLTLTEDKEIPYWKKYIQQKFIAKNKDITCKADKIVMIDKRISHYKELQVKKQIRALNRELRKEQEEAKIQQLQEQINELYGQLPNKRKSSRIIS